MHTPLDKSHTIYVTNTPTSSISSSYKLRSSFATLNGLNSSTSFSSHSLKTPSARKDSWTPGSKPGALPNRQNSESRRSVRWLDGASGKDGFSRLQTTDPAKMWARYTRTVRPEFKFTEPSIGRAQGRRKSKGAKEDSDDDGRFAMKLSLPCPSHSSCCFCVYSRQLGPVRVYFSHLPRPKPNAVGRTRRVHNGVKHVTHTAASYPLDLDEKNRVFLKERWMTCSAPSGEVVVPDFLDDPLETYHRRNALLGELHGGRIRTDSGFRRTRNFVLEARSSKTRQWLNSAPVNASSHDSAYSFLDTDTDKQPFNSARSDYARSQDAWSCDESVLRVPRNSPRSRGSSPVGTIRAGRGEGNRRQTFLMKGNVRGPPPFPVHKTSAPLRLLSTRQGF